MGTRHTSLSRVHYHASAYSSNLENAFYQLNINKSIQIVCGICFMSNQTVCSKLLHLLTPDLQTCIHLFVCSAPNVRMLLSGCCCFISINPDSKKNLYLCENFIIIAVILLVAMVTTNSCCKYQTSHIIQRFSAIELHTVDNRFIYIYMLVQL